MLLSKTDHESKLENLIATLTYKQLQKDPTATQEDKLSRILKPYEKRGVFSKQLYYRLRPSGCQPPRIYGLPKIHKPSTPLRPIVSCINSPSYELSKYISSIISPLAGQTTHHIKNSRNVVLSMKDFIIDRDEVLVSFDISSLFTNVAIDEASHVIKSILQQDDSLQERTSLCPDDVILLLNTCLTPTYFSYKDLFYQQKEGTAMGSPVSPIVANLFMEYFEHVGLTSAPYVPRLWKRYVDDIFCIMKKSQVNSFLQHLNSIRPSIKFSMELETNGSLPFLDTLLSRKDDGHLNITVYRKSTHTDRYLKFNSHHPDHVKKGLIRCLYDRAKNVTISPIDLKQEQHHLLLQHNGYPANFIHSTLHPSHQSSSLSTSTPDTFCASIVLLYISGLSEDI